MAIATREPLDEKTFQLVHLALHSARNSGRDPAEELQRHGVLLSAAVELELKVEALRRLLQELRNWRPAEFTRRKDKTGTGTTAADQHMRICEYIEDHISDVRGK
jgi:hypothetical protein